MAAKNEPSAFAAHLLATYPEVDPPFASKDGTPKLYKITRIDNTDDREAVVLAVVVAPDRETASRIHPRTGGLYGTGPCKCCGLTDPSNGGWRDGLGWAPGPNYVDVKYLGEASSELTCPKVVSVTTLGAF